MTFLDRLCAAWRSYRGPPNTARRHPGTAAAVTDSASQESWRRLDGSWFAGRTVSYVDPMQYCHGTLEDLVGSEKDMVWIEKFAEPYPEVTQYASFLDHATPPLPPYTPNLPPLKPCAYVMGRSDVALSGYRAFIGRNGCYNLDEIFTTPAIERIETARLGHPEIYRNEQIGLEDTDVPAVFTLNVQAKRFVTIDETVICLGSNEAPNYGSFIFRMFPKLLQVARLPQNLKILVPQYFDNLMPFLELAGIEKDRLIPQYLDHIYFIKRAIVPSMRNRDLFLDDETLGFYDAVRARHGIQTPTRRIYISRRAFSGSLAAGRRVMTNESDVIALLEGFGFEVTEPEKLSPLEQIRLFSSAAVVVGAGGSAMFNTVFCHPGTSLIDIEAEPHWVGGHMRIFRSRGLRFGIFEGTPTVQDFSTPHIPFTVDTVRLRSRLESFLPPVR